MEGEESPLKELRGSGRNGDRRVEEVWGVLRGVRSRSLEGRVGEGTVEMGVAVAEEEEESMKEPAERRGSGGRWWEKGKSGRVGS